MLAGTAKLIACLVFAAASIYLLGMGCLMLYSSKVLKLQDRDRLLQLIDWSGSERVLDVGCGRGLMLIGAAKRLSSGRATGVDLWQQQDQADNSVSAVLHNAALEDVADRIGIQTADARQLPFMDHHFDVVLSSWTIHNIEPETQRRIALDEIIRVLKPNGIVILGDIVHQAEYAAHFRYRGMHDVQLHHAPLRDIFLKAVTFGSFAPSAVIARKAAR